MLFVLIPNIWNRKLLQYYFRFAVAIFSAVFLCYWIWFPTKVATTPGMHFNSASGALLLFYNGIDQGEARQASDAYCRIISILFGAWVFYGYDASAHLAEETRRRLLRRVSGSAPSARGYCPYLR